MFKLGMSKSEKRLIKLLTLALLLMAMIGNAVAQSDQVIPVFNPVGMFESGMTWLINQIVEAVKSSINSLVQAIIKLLVEVPIPHNMATKDYWSECFDIYISQLLPLSLVFLGIYIMFSSQPPNRVLFEEYVKRVSYATLLAFFSFTIIDTLVWFTNKLASLIVDVHSVNVANVLVGALAGGGGIIALLSMVGAGVLEAIILIIAFFILALRVAAIQFIAATMPIFCFFLIIGVGPLKRLSDLAEYIWGAGVILPVFSIIGAGLVKLLFYATAWQSIAGGGIMGALFIAAAFILILAYPWMLTSALGMFHTGMHALYPIARPFSAAMTGLGMARYMRHYQAFGRAAPLTIMMPSKLAAWGASKMGIAEKFRSAHAFKARQSARTFAEIGIPASAFGKLYEIGSRMQDGDVITPDIPEAKSAFRTISHRIGRYAERVAESGGFEEIERLESVLSALHGKRLSLQDGLLEALKANYEYAVRRRDFGAVALPAFILAARDTPTLMNFLKQIKLVQGVLKSDFAKAYLATYGVKQRDVEAAMYGDEQAARMIVNRLNDAINPKSPARAYYNTFEVLLNETATEKDVAMALGRDLEILHWDSGEGFRGVGGEERYNRIIETIAEAANERPEVVRHVVDTLDDEGIEQLARQMLSSKNRAIEVLGEKAMEDGISLPEMDKAEAARRLAEFIREGGYLVGQIESGMAKHLKDLTAETAKEQARLTSWREHISRAAGDFHKTLTRTGHAMVYDDDWYYLEYRSMLRMRPPPISPRSITPKYL
ncbi:hypothetical protein DRP05_02785 [Archaeoglobales archaeon]|nr:MAG: hypothetical protein DRP05_02785 [Archaeoglobales archaeon]